MTYAICSRHSRFIAPEMAISCSLEVPESRARIVCTSLPVLAIPHSAFCDFPTGANCGNLSQGLRTQEFALPGDPIMRRTGQIAHDKTAQNYLFLSTFVWNFPRRAANFHLPILGCSESLHPAKLIRPIEVAQVAECVSNRWARLWLRGFSLGS